MNKINIELSSEWVLSCANGDKLPGDAIVTYIQDKKLGTVEETSFTGISFTSDSVSQNNLKEFKDTLISYLKGIFQVSAEQLSQSVTVSAEPVAASAAPETKEPETKKPEPVKQPVERPRRNVQQTAPQTTEPTVPAIEEIRQLQGAEQFIALCEEIKRMAPILCEKSLQSVVTSISYVFSIDPGCGHSTVLSKLSRLMTEEGLFASKGTPLEVTLEAGGAGMDDPLKSAASKIFHSREKVVSIDISNWCDKVTSPEFRSFLILLQKNAEKYIYVFRLPYLERSVLDAVEDALSDLMRIRTVTFVPLTAAQLQVVSEKLLSQKGFSVTASGWELFQRRLAEEKSDGLFYGIKTAEKIVEDMMFLKIQSILAGTSAQDDVIDAVDIATLATGSGSVVSAEEMLNGLLGIDSIRAKIYEIVAQIEFARQTPGVLSPAMHMRFIGNPGTGKTTVARIVGRLLKERGILSKGYFFERSGGDFIGMYVGHTAPKTLALCRDAYGSVLFIDEAYTLASSTQGNVSSFAKEAVDTLIAQMENHRDDMVVIMAGYPNEMAELMRMNPGLAGRMPYVLEFPNYTRDQLAAIFTSMVSKSKFTLTPEAEECAAAYFAELDDSILGKYDFANARFVRNVFECTWSKAVTRSQLDGSDPLVITKDDFTAATAEGETTQHNKTKKRSRPGYHLGLV